MPAGYTPAANVAEAIELVTQFGMPEHMMLDFDLGGEDKAITFLKWLYNSYPDGPVPDYTIHSKNGPGSAFMKSYLDSWKRSLA
jgi:hypothetical protein